MKALIICMIFLPHLLIAAEKPWEPLAAPTMTFQEGFPLRLEDDNRHALAAPRDPAEVESQFAKREFPLTGLAALAAALALALLGAKSRKTKRQPTEQEKAERVRSQTLEELKALRNTLSKTTPDAFYCRITDLMRFYLENVHHLEADTKTTEEFFQDIAVSTVLDPKMREELHTFLDTADKVKFAHEVADSRMEEESLAFAEKFIGG